MIFRNIFSLLAFAVLAGAILYLTYLSPYGPGGHQPTGGVEKVAQPNDKGHQPKTEQASPEQAKRPAAEQEQAGAAYYTADCKKPKQHQDADFCQQVRMADAAESQNRLNAWGLGALIATLVATGLAAVAAWRTVWTMQDTAKRELRAYVGVAKVEIAELAVGKRTRLSITLKNFGQTPAYKVERWTDMKIGLRSDKDFPEDTSEKGLKVMNPDDAFVISSQHTAELTQAEMDSLTADTARIFLWGKISYVDAFSRPQTATFRLEYGGPHTMTIRAFAYCEQGNDAT